MSRRGYLALFGALVAGAGAVAALWPAGEEARRAALVGVALCAVTGGVSLALKGMAKTLNHALMVVVVVFFLRAMGVVLGGVWAAKWGNGAMPFVLGFFGTYFPLQWVEIGFLLAGRQRSGGQPEGS